MSLETQIGSLIALVGDTLKLPQAIATTAREQIAAVSTAYQQAISSAEIQRYVAQNVGSDNNAGTQASPYKTINRALADCPPGGLVTAILQADYAMTEHVRVFNKRLRIAAPTTSARPTITFGQYLIAAENVRALWRFTMEGDAQVSILGGRLVVPSNAGYTAATRDFRSALIGPPDGVSDSILVRQAVGLLGCEINIGPDPYGAVVSGPMIQLYGANMTATGQTLLGRLIEGYSNTAGTAAKDAPNVFTNLGLI